MSDKGSESDEGEANKDSPSERDEDSDKQSDTELDEMDGDDEEVRESQRRGWETKTLQESQGSDVVVVCFSFQTVKSSRDVFTEVL